MTRNKIIYTAIILVIAIAGASFLFARGNDDSQTVDSVTPTAAITFDEAAYPPNGWTQSMVDAVDKAAREDKMILLNYTGSDWCVWCQKLEEEVFSQREFLDWADENLVMVFLDSPSDIAQDEALVEQNQIMQQALGVQGFPTIFLLDSDLTPLLQTGYQEGGVETYLAHLQNDRINMPEEDAEKFRTGFSQMIEETLVSLEG